MTAIISTAALALVVLLGLGVWIWLALFSVGIVSLEIFRTMPVDLLLAQTTYGTVTTPELISLPLFILMAEILYRTKLSELLFAGLAPWANPLPGRLLHVNVLGCTLFAAVSGSSAATAATVGRITLTELFRRGYDRNIVMGSLAGAGTLGLLIPPSIVFIIYGVLSETSILKLFIAGIIPGLILAGMFMLYIGIRTTIDRSLVPLQTENSTWRERIMALPKLGPVVLLVVMVIGSMYGGYASPSEAAAVGVLGSVIVSAMHRTLNWQNVKLACLGAVRTTSMIGLIVTGAMFLSISMGFLGVPRTIATEIAALQLSPFMLIMLLLVFYAALGCILDGMSAIVMTLPITLPLVVAHGFDPIWFGVFLVIVVETAQITPPVGFNLFIIQAMTSESIGRIALAAFPFFIIMVLMAILITIVPDIVMFLPDRVTLGG